MIPYDNLELLHEELFKDLSSWHHEGIGEIELLPASAGNPGGPFDVAQGRPEPGRTGGMRLRCFGSRQSAEGCMAFFRPTLPDQVSIEYDLAVQRHGGLVINYLAIRGLNGEDLIEDRDRLPPRTGVMKNYWSKAWGLQSYHFSISRFDDAGRHTQTSNWRRNPGSRLVGHGTDPCQEIGRRYALRIVKDNGHCQLFADGAFAHGIVDWDRARPVPDSGKFGFRLIGSDVMAEVFNFRIHRVAANRQVWRDHDEPR